jgi:superfamily II DNA or RNA helicase
MNTRNYQRTAKIKLLDEVNAVIIGLRNEDIEFLWDEYGVFAPNYFFNPKFKLGVWDGRIRFFSKTGKTYIHFIPEIISILQKMGYKLELIDYRTSDPIEVEFIDENHFSHVLHPLTREPITLRYYQVDAVNALLKEGKGVVIAGTGSGKTFMTAALVSVYGNQGLKTITIVPTQDLIYNTKDEFVRCGLDVGEYSGSMKDIDHYHVVSTWQALQYNSLIIKEFQVVVIDECHGIKGQVLRKILNEVGNKIIYRFGLTGTLPKESADVMAVFSTIGTPVYEISSYQLQQENFLSQSHIDIIQLKENFIKEYEEYLAHNKEKYILEKKPTYLQFKDAFFPEWAAEKSYLQTHKPRLKWITEYIVHKRDTGQGNIFCLVNNIQFGKKLAKMIEGSVFLYGKNKKEDRKEVYESFNESDNLVIFASVQIAGVGLNIPRIFNLMYIDIGKSFIRTIQSIGRGLRKAPDKDKVIVTDICSDLKYGKRHLRNRINYYDEAKYPYKKHGILYEQK